MRSLLVVSCLASAAEAAPIDLVFRWAVEPLECRNGMETRSSRNRCLASDAKQPFLVVAYSATTSDPVSVIRYNGDDVRAPQKWVQSVDLGKLADPVVVVDPSTTTIAGVVDGAVVYATLASADGKSLTKPTTLVATGAARIQLARVGAITMVYVLMKDGSGRVVGIDAKGTPARSIPARAIRTRMTRGVSADGDAKAGAYRAEWDGPALVVRHAGTSVNLVDDDRFRMHQVTLHLAKDRAIATVHHGMAAGSQAVAVGVSGILWKRGLTGIGPVVHSGYTNRLSAFVDGDLLVVQGVESGGAYICTVAIADGSEFACVDHLPAIAVAAPTAPKRLPKALPPSQPIGPQTAGPNCARLGNPDKNFTIKRVDANTVSGTIVTPSATCKPKLGGGIVGDRIELEVWDGGDKPGPAACTCVFQYRQAVKPESKTAIARVRGGIEIGRLAVP